MSDSGNQSKQVRDKAKEYVFPSAFTYYEEPLVIEEGKGATVRDADGREYLDFFGGILTVGLGHCHPEITKRTREQAEKVQHTSSLYLTGPSVALRSPRMRRLYTCRFGVNSRTKTWVAPSWVASEYAPDDSR